MAKPIMGIQLYTLRDHIKTAGDFDATLARLAAMGVTDVQISGIGDFPCEAQRAIMDKHNMKVCITHKSFDWMKEDIDEVIRHHQVLGCDAIGIGSAPGEGRGNKGNVRRFIKESAEVAEKLKAAGMTFHYHNHAFEFNRLDDNIHCMMDFLLNETDPDLFHFIPDVAWIHYGGADPAEILRKMKGRVKVLHFKDYAVDAQGNRKFVSLGQGIVDLKACYEAACELEIPYIMYEQDCDWKNDDPFLATEESWAFMQSLQK